MKGVQMSRYKWLYILVGSILIMALSCTIVLCIEMKNSRAETEKPIPLLSVDTSNLDADHAYTVLNNVLTAPDNYIDKVLRVSGQYTSILYEDRLYHAVVVRDSDGCCQQVLEFVLADRDSSYPDANTVITVTGTFELYVEDGHTYAHLRDADMEVSDDVIYEK